MDLLPKLQEIKQRYSEFEWHYLDGHKFSLALSSRIITDNGELHFGFRYYTSHGRTIMKEITQEMQEYLNAT